MIVVSFIRELLFNVWKCTRKQVKQLLNPTGRTKARWFGGI